MLDRAQPDHALGVYETLLILDGSPIELDAHLDRLRRSVRELFAAEPPAGVRELARETAAALSVGRLRLRVAPAGDRELIADAIAGPVDADDLFPAWERAAALIPLTLPGGLGAHKWADRSRLASAESHAAQRLLPLVLDAGEEVLEASRANVFAVADGELLTPAADRRILPGIARTRAIDAARSLGIDVREGPLSLERLLAAGEVFLTGSVRGVEPVRAVGDTPLRPPGEAIAAIATELRRNWTRSAAAHAA